MFVLSRRDVTMLFHRAMMLVAATLSMLAAGLAQQRFPVHTIPPALRVEVAVDLLLSWAPLSFRIHEHVDLLASADAAKRRRGGDYLFALLSLGAERAAERLPEGDRTGVDQDDLVQHLAQALSQLPFGGDGAEALPAVAWLLQHAPPGRLQDFAVRGLRRIHVPETQAYFADVFANGSPLRSANRRVLELVAMGRLPATADDLKRWALHHDEVVRDEANALLVARGEEPVPYTRGDTFGARIDDLLELARQLLPEPLPPEAPWAELTLSDSAVDMPDPEPIHGWVLQEGDAERPWRLLLASGRVQEVVNPGATVAYEPLTNHATRIVAWRDSWAETEDLDVRARIEQRIGLERSFRSSNESWPGTAAELLVAAWCKLVGETDAAADLLEPLLEAAWDEREVVDQRLHQLALGVDEAMVVAFAHRRDYERAASLAQLLSRPELVGFVHRERAVELARQLPERRDDFRGLVLPTPAEWERLRRDLPRAELVAHLVARLRLLSCQQMSIPGGIDNGQRQQGGPVDWARGTVADERVNPFVELIRLDLAVGELPALLPALASRDYVLAFDLQRFLPQGPAALHRVAWVAATLANEIAQQPVVDPTAFLAGGDVCARAREAFVVFCRERPHQRHSDLLAEKIATGEPGQESMLAFWRLYDIDPVRAAAAVHAAAAADESRLPQAVRLLALLDRREFIGDARAWLQHSAAEVRFFAACMLLRQGVDTEAAFAVLVDALATQEAVGWVGAAIEPLLATPKPAARQVLVDLLAGGHASGYRPTLGVVQRLLRAGISEAKVLLDRVIAGETTIHVRDFDGSPEPLTQESLQWCMGAWWPDQRARLSGMPLGLDALRSLVEADWQRIQQGTPPTMVAGDSDLPWGDLTTYSRGWVRVR